MSSNYIIRKDNIIKVGNEVVLTNSKLVDAMNLANDALRSLDEQTREFDINIFEVMGMRNLSGVVGEYLGKSIQKISNNSLHSNLHQDGYPDLMLTNTKERLDYFNTLYIEKSGKKYPKDKALFSPYKYGGIEVKATCGSTPCAKIAPKPLMGEQRIKLVNSFDWKAHHRSTNNLVGIIWDFIDQVPTIVCAFYSNSLVTDDWGKIVQPKEGGGRTTSVSIMSSSGIKKMCSGWVAILDDQQYIDAMSRPKWVGYKVK